jgi:leucyl-tRNA synthetase
MGLLLDWRREFATCDPAYSGHWQMLFLVFLKAGLVERRERWVNRDPVDGTVSANERVIDDRGWHSDAPAEKEQLSQWFFCSTHYIEKVLATIGQFDRWPQHIRVMQAKWLSCGGGARLCFELVAPEQSLVRAEVYSTRPYTLSGISSLVVSPEHPIAAVITIRDPAAADFVLVLMEHGTGAIFGCSVRGQLGLDLARELFFQIMPVKLAPGADPTIRKIGSEGYFGSGAFFNSGLFGGLEVDTAKRASTKLGRCGVGKCAISWRARDWGVSQQRYWDCLISPLQCGVCGVVPVPKEQSPGLLPDEVTFDRLGNTIGHHPTRKRISHSGHGIRVTRKTDTCDAYVNNPGSFARFGNPQASGLVRRPAADHWIQGYQHTSGIEHGSLHLLYSRFITNTTKEKGDMPVEEPFAGWFTPGMVRHRSHRVTAEPNRAWLCLKKMVKKSDVIVIGSRGGEPLVLGCVRAMRKSRANTFDTGATIARYGTHTARCFILSDKPPDRDIERTKLGMAGAARFTQHSSRLAEDSEPTQGAPSIGDIRPAVRSMHRATHPAIAEVTEVLDGFAFNVGVVRLHEPANEFGDARTRPAGTRLRAAQGAGDSGSPRVPGGAAYQRRELRQAPIRVCSVGGRNALAAAGFGFAGNGYRDDSGADHGQAARCGCCALDAPADLVVVTSEGKPNMDRLLEGKRINASDRAVTFVGAR